MGLKFWLIAMTTCAVVSDALLLPFYPAWFAQRFDVHSPQHAGTYFAAVCLTAMLALPLWARRCGEQGPLRLLQWTQLAAGLLALLCSQITHLPLFWVVSLAMIVFKASYLLIYPWLLQGVQEQEHSHTIGVLSIVVHFGHIAGAVLGGWALARLPLESLFLIMAAGDFIQMLICRWVLWRRLHLGWSATAAAAPATPVPTGTARRVWALGLLMLLFYFSEYQVVPFFVEYWQHIAPRGGLELAAWVYAIPAGVALLALWLNRRSPRGGVLDSLPLCLTLGMVGLLLQASGDAAWVLAGRVVYGWAAFQLTVRLDALLFAMSTPADYARDYSRINIMQNLGVLLSTWSAGWLVAHAGLALPFVVAAAGFLLTLLLTPLLLRDAPSLSARSPAHVTR